MLTLATKFVPVRSAFELAKNAGFRAAEFWLNGKLLEESDRIASLANEYSFRLALHFPNHPPISEQALRNTVDLYHQLNCTAIVIHQPMYDLYATRIREFDPDVRLAIENHDFDLIGFEQWAERSPGLTLDVEHLWKFTLRDTPLAGLLKQVDRFLDRHAGKLYHVHLPGYVPGGDEHHPIFESLEMATEVLNRLAAHGFSRLVVSEADVPFQTMEFLQKDVEFFERWLRDL